MIEEELEKTSTKNLRYLLASGITGREYNLTLTEYLARPDRKGHIKKRRKINEK